MRLLRRTIVPLALLALTACRDEPVASVQGLKPSGPTRNNLVADNLEPATYWRTSNLLWVWDTRPEVGVGIHHQDAISFTQVEDLRMRLTRIGLVIDWYSTNRWIDDGLYADRFKPRIQGMCDRGLVPVVVVHSPAGFMDGSDASYAWFGNFMEQVAHDNPCVRFWQLWNEMEVEFPGSAYFGNGSDYDQGVRYARMLQYAYPAIKRGNPASWVLMGGITSTAASWAFVRGVYDGGGKPYFDIFAQHVYGSQPYWNNPNIYEEGVSGDGVRERGQRLRNVAAEKGDRGRPVWLTEFGASAGAYHMAWGFPSEQDDGAAYDAHHEGWWREALDIADGSRLYAKVLGYQLFAGEEGAPAGANTPGWGQGDFTFGLVRADRVTPRPTYTYLRDVRQINASIRGAAHARGMVSVRAPGIRPAGYPFTRNGEYVQFEVLVNKLFPTEVQFEHDPDYEGPGDPGGCFPHRLCF